MANSPSVLLIGATGRLGSLVQKTDLTLSGKISVMNADRFEEFCQKAQIILDVSHPNVTIGLIKKLQKLKYKIPYVIGCTGFTSNQMKIVHEYSKKTCVLVSPNFSLLIQILAKFFQENAELLSQFGYSVSIKESHHQHKKDSPSGTAQLFADIFKKTKPKIDSVRTGEVIGVHEVLLSGIKDTLLIKHEAHDRALFADGARFATRWLFSHSKTCKKGLFTMQNAIEKTV